MLKKMLRIFKLLVLIMCSLGINYNLLASNPHLIKIDHQMLLFGEDPKKWNVDISAMTAFRPASLGSDRYKFDILPNLIIQYSNVFAFSLLSGIKWRALDFNFVHWDIGTYTVFDIKRRIFEADLNLGSDLVFKFNLLDLSLGDFKTGTTNFGLHNNFAFIMKYDFDNANAYLETNSLLSQHTIFLSQILKFGDSITIEPRWNIITMPDLNYLNYYFGEDPYDKTVLKVPAKSVGLSVRAIYRIFSRLAVSAYFNWEEFVGEARTSSKSNRNLELYLSVSIRAY